MEIADLPRATFSPSWRRLRPTIISCAASLARYCFAFDAPEKRPSRFAGARRARIEDHDLALPLGIEQTIPRTDFFGLDQRRIVPDRFGHVGGKAVDKFLGVIGPEMAAPPVLGIAHFRQHHRRHHRFQDDFAPTVR